MGSDKHVALCYTKRKRLRVERRGQGGGDRETDTEGERKQETGGKREETVRKQ